MHICNTFDKIVLLVCIIRRSFSHQFLASFFYNFVHYKQSATMSKIFLIWKQDSLSLLRITGLLNSIIGNPSAFLGITSKKKKEATAMILYYSKAAHLEVYIFLFFTFSKHYVVIRYKILLHCNLNI